MFVIIGLVLGIFALFSRNRAFHLTMDACFIIVGLLALLTLNPFGLVLIPVGILFVVWDRKRYPRRRR